jgi:uncharacterized membrane protein YgcG
MKSFAAIVLLLVCLKLNAQSDKSLSFKWQDNLSGSATLSPSDFISAKKGLVLYCLSNDDKNIYVDVRITESIEQSKVLQMGLILWINADGKSRKITGIRFPIGAKFSKFQINRGEVQVNNSIVKVSPLSMANTIELIGFKDITVKRFPSNNPDNIRGSLKYDNDGNLLYSLTVPLEKLPQSGKISEGGLNPMTFAIEYGAPPANAGEQSGRSSGSAPSSGGGGGRSGGRSGGGSRGGSIGSGPSGPAPGQDEPKSEIIWIKNVKLAEKK